MVRAQSRKCGPVRETGGDRVGNGRFAQIAVLRRRLGELAISTPLPTFPINLIRAVSAGKRP
jgi:hypothetical protein